MISVGKPVMTNSGEITKAVFSIKNGVTNETHDLIYEFEREYEEHFTEDRADGVLVSMLHWLAVNHYDVRLEQPVSEHLYYQIIEHLLPAWDSKIKIHCKTTNVYYPPGKHVATGMSCGVDSITTHHLHHASPPPYRLSMLTFFGAGAIWGSWSRQTELFKEELANSKRFAEAVGVPLFVVNSNMDAIFDEKHLVSHTFRNCGVVLLFQKMFHVYFYSSTVPFELFSVDINGDAGHYELFTLPLLSLPNIKFFSSGASLSRIEKTRRIKDSELAQKFLNVCVYSSHNCGDCFKCIRTLATLDSMDRLDEFSEVFDIEKYRKKRAKVIGTHILLGKFRPDFADFAHEIYIDLKSNKKIPASSYMWAFLRLVVSPFRWW